MPVDFKNAQDIQIKDSPINNIAGNNNVQNSASYDVDRCAGNSGVGSDTKGNDHSVPDSDRTIADSANMTDDQEVRVFTVPSLLTSEASQSSPAPTNLNTTN